MKEREKDLFVYVMACAITLFATWMLCAMYYKDMVRKAKDDYDTMQVALAAKQIWSIRLTYWNGDTNWYHLGYNQSLTFDFFVSNPPTTLTITNAYINP